MMEDQTREMHVSGSVHDVGLVDGRDALAAVGLGVLKGEAGNALGGLAGDELDALDDALDDFVLDAAVLALGVLANDDQIDICRTDASEYA